MKLKELLIIYLISLSAMFCTYWIGRIESENIKLTAKICEGVE